MTREELLAIAKPVLFNTEMVQAILEGRKTVTRRCVKYKYSNTEMKMHTDKYGTRLIEIQKNVEGETHGRHPDGRTWQKLLPYIEKKPPFKKGDYLYVRETWCKGVIACGEEPDGRDTMYVSQCEGEDDYILKAHALHENIGIEDVVWKPSIHMPKEAARIFLKVTDVRVEQLQDMNGGADFLKEGLIDICVGCGTPKEFCDCCGGLEEEFIELWDSTIKKADLDTYGWDANPWVWVVEFERVEV